MSFNLLGCCYEVVGILILITLHTQFAPILIMVGISLHKSQSSYQPFSNVRNHFLLSVRFAVGEDGLMDCIMAMSGRSRVALGVVV